MDIDSIDNAYEDDGIANVVAFLTDLNRRFAVGPHDPTRPVLVAIVPEYHADGRLDRLDCLSVPACDPGRMTDAQAVLMDAAAAVVAEWQAKRSVAEAKLVKPIGVRQSPAGGGQ